MGSRKLGLADYDDNDLGEDVGLQDGEEFVGHKGHSKLIKSLQEGQSNKTRGAVRREAAPNVAEFSAVKQRSTVIEASNLKHLLEAVKETGEGKALEKVNKLVKAPSKQKIQTLELPLEKPVALKTKRTVLYDKAKRDVSRWNAVVYHNRLADQLVYPLNSGKKLPKKSGKDLAADFIPMTPLEEEMAKILYGEEYLKERKASMEKSVGPSDAEAYMLSVEEALSVHSEMARLRALQSYEMAKAKRQNKIKSKKYHRLLRKDKIKKQLKEFEEMQQTDPEQAMVKLTELEESRVQERMSLKHRNTSKWAKMQSARAKYNKESRVALSEQLKISRDLTQKVQESTDEEDDLDTDLPQLVKPSMDNPWMLNPEVQGNEKLQLYYSGYKKLWEDINSKKAEEQKKQLFLDEQIAKKAARESQEKLKDEIVKPSSDDDQSKVLAPTETKSVPTKRSAKNRKVKKSGSNVEAEPRPLKSILPSEDEDGSFTEHDLEGLFEKAENKIKSQALKKLKGIEKHEKAQSRRLARSMKNRNERGGKKTKKEKEGKQKEGDADEIRELMINDEDENFEIANGQTLDLMTIRQKGSSIKRPIEVEEYKPELINPDNYLKISKQKKAKRSKFDGEGMKKLEFEDGKADEDEDRQGLLIADAFEDDDVVAEFKKHKDDEINASKPQDIDLHLPGWGEWGGKGIKPNKKRRARFVIKAPPPPPRKDARLSHVIFNEEASEKVKDHQVRNLPFPFKRVKDFEKSIRAPIGRTWLPQQSTKDLIAPKVITRLGSIIKPLDEDVLVKNKEERSKAFKVPLSIKTLAKTKKLRK